MERMVLNVYKKRGETPLETIMRVKKTLNEKGEKFTYAGRLDPLAEGVLILLSGKDIKKKEKFLVLPKVYTAEIVFGFATDTYDILGLPLKPTSVEYAEILTKNSIIEFSKTLEGEITLPYPPFSSKPVLGRPLFLWARSFLTPLSVIPKNKTRVEQIDVLELSSITANELFKDVIQITDLVSGDFRQEKTKEKWLSMLSTNQAKTFQVAKIRFGVSSGTYIRSLANLIGEHFGQGACIIKLVRESVGKYELSGSIR